MSAPTTDVDVLVVGAGTSGSIAAIQAARLGARTMLVERNGMFGGTTTVAGVALPGLFHAWGRQVIAGIGWDLVRRSVELDGGRLPDFTAFRQPHYRLQVPVNPYLYATLLAEKIDRSGVLVRLHTMVAGIERRADGWQVTVCGKEGLSRVTARRVVDATGDADVVGQAGLARVANRRPQPGTIMCRFGGYDVDGLDLDELDRAYHVAVAEGRLQVSDLSDSQDAIGKFLRAGGSNRVHVLSENGATSAGRTANELEARRAVLRILRFLKGLPGLSGVRLEYLAVESGVRESVTIVGRDTITVTDYTSGRVWPEAVCFSFYPVDVHQPDGDGIDIRPLAEGVVATIPRGALVPSDDDLICVAGRSIAGDQEANSAYRVQATSMATGQAAGALAALGATTGVGLSAVPIGSVHRVLREHGAIVPHQGDDISTAAEPSTSEVVAAHGRTDAGGTTDGCS